MTRWQCFVAFSLALGINSFGDHTARLPAKESSTVW